MLTQKEQLEYELLRMLYGNEQPMGSSTLSLMLKERGIESSAATIGRVLGEFDFLGLTERLGFRGRILTGAGEEKLNELQRRQDLAEYSSLFYSTVDAKSKDNLVDVLVARRGIEREVVRLAAQHATEEDIRSIQRIYGLQSEKAQSGLVSSEDDVVFHRAIATASKNKVLAAAYDFIWQNGRYSPIMEYVRTAVGGTVAVEHGRILAAIEERDAEAAEKAMVAHIDSLIVDVNNYWEQSQKSRNKKKKPKKEEQKQNKGMGAD